VGKAQLKLLVERGPAQRQNLLLIWISQYRNISLLVSRWIMDQFL